MEHATSHAATPTPTKPIVAPIGGGLSGASIGLGFFSMCVFWWYPFSPILSTVGLVLGLTVAMCVGSAWLAVGKVKKVDPADVF